MARTSKAPQKKPSRRGKAEPRRGAGSVVDDRLSSRRKAVARSKRRKWWIGLAALAGAAVLAVAAWALLHTGLFSIRNLTVEGELPGQEAKVLTASGITKGVPLITIDATAAATSIEAVPWVDKADVAPHWPTSVRITVSIRHPVGTIDAGRRTALIDATGRVIGRPVAVPTYDPAPVVLSIEGVRPGKPGSWLPSAASPAVKVASKLPMAFRGQVARVIGHKDGTVSLEMTAPVRVDLGTSDKLHAKFKDVAAIIAGTALHAGDVVDVSVPQASTIARG